MIIFRWTDIEGNVWRYHPSLKEWFGYRPGEEGVWHYSDAEFEDICPEAVAARREVFDD